MVHRGAAKEPGHHQHHHQHYFAGCNFVIELGEELGFLPFAQKAAIIRRVTEHGGRVVPVVDSDTTAVLSRPHTAAEFDQSLTLQHAVRNGVPILRCSAYLDACAAASTRVPNLTEFTVHIPKDSQELPAIVADVTARKREAGARGATKIANVSRSVLKSLQPDGDSLEQVVWHANYDERVVVDLTAEKTTVPFFPVDASVDATSAGYEVIRLLALSLPGHECVELHASLSVSAGSKGQPRFRVYHARTGTVAAAFFNSADAAEACVAAVWKQCNPSATSVADVMKLTFDGAGSSIGARRSKAGATAAHKPLPAAIETVVRTWFSDAWIMLNERTSAAAAGSARDVLGKISMLDVYKAEAILLRISDIIAARLMGKTDGGNGAPGEAEVLVSLSDAYFALIPPAAGTSSEQRTIASSEQLADAEDTMRILRAALNVGEEAGGNVFGLGAKSQYRSLGCEIEAVASNWRGLPQHERLRELVLAEVASGGSRRVTKVYAVRREAEHRAFTGKSVGNCQLLVHGTPAGCVAPILSLGLQVPKAQRLRRDRGMLGRGIYFGDRIATAAKYAGRSKVEGHGRKFYVLVAEVALGKSYETMHHEFGLEQAPPGYDSVHGVVANGGDFSEDELVVYRESSQRLSYVLEMEDTTLDVAPMKGVPPMNAPALPTAAAAAVGDLSLVAKVDELGSNVRVKAVQAGLQSKGGDEPVPLRATRVKASIIDLIAEVNILQEYENTGASAIEAKYVFPLQRGAAVCGFEAYINSKRVVGKVKEKEEARREYKKAVEAGHGAYLMDESEEAPDVFTISVGNLPPKTRVVIKITYVIELKVDATRQAIEFVLPSSVHPAVRDTELKTSTQQTTDTIASYETCGDVAVEVGLDMPFDIVAVECSHPMERKRTACRANIRSQDVDMSKGDLTVWTRLAVMHTPRIWVEANTALGTKAAMITFFPDLDESLGKAEKSRAKETIIMLDASGSMAQGNAAEDAKIGALAAIDKLPCDWRFNVVLFGSQQVWCFPASRDASTESKTSAKAFVQKLYGPIMGGTNCRDALRSLALLVGGCKPSGGGAVTGTGLPFLVDTGSAEASGASGLRQIEVLLFSDGLFEQEAELHALLRGSPGLRVFGVAVGTSSGVAALVGVCRRGRGQVVTLPHDAKSRWCEALTKQVERAGVAALTDIGVEWSTEQSQRIRDSINSKVEQSPPSVASVFSGESSVVYGVVTNVQTRQCELIARHTGVGVRRDQYGQFPEQRFLVTVNGTSFRTGAIIHRLAAKARIRDWVEGSLLKAPSADASKPLDTIAHNEACKAATKAAIIALGCEYGLVTPFTSMIAVEERSEDEQRRLAEGRAGECTTPSIEALARLEVVDPIPEASFLEEHAERWDRLPPVSHHELPRDETWVDDDDAPDGTDGETSSSEGDAAADGELALDAAELEARRVAAAKQVKKYTPLKEIEVPPTVMEPLDQVDKALTLYVKTLTGRTITVNVRSDSTVEDVMEAVRAACGIPHQQQRLIFNGHQLDPLRYLTRYDITPESTLHLVLRLRGSNDDGAGGAVPQALASQMSLESASRNRVTSVSTEAMLQMLHEAPLQVAPSRPHMRQFVRHSAQRLAVEDDESTGMQLERDTANSSLTAVSSPPSQPASSPLARRKVMMTGGRSAKKVISRRATPPSSPSASDGSDDEQEDTMRADDYAFREDAAMLRCADEEDDDVPPPMAAAPPPMAAAPPPMALRRGPPGVPSVTSFAQQLYGAPQAMSSAPMFGAVPQSLAAPAFAAMSPSFASSLPSGFVASSAPPPPSPSAVPRAALKSSAPVPAAAAPSVSRPVASAAAPAPQQARQASAAQPAPQAQQQRLQSESMAKRNAQVKDSRQKEEKEASKAGFEESKARRMKEETEDRQRSRERLERQMRDAKEAVHCNMERMLERGEKLDSLMEASESLQEQAQMFAKASERKMKSKVKDDVAFSLRSSSSSAMDHCLLLLDVTPLSTGFAHRADDVMRVVLRRNTTVPCRKTAALHAPEDNCSVLDIIICEGELVAGSRNNTLAEIKETVPTCNKGDLMGCITFDIDANGILTVAVDVETRGGPAREIRRTITNDKGRLSKDDIERMVVEGEREANRLKCGARLKQLPISTKKSAVEAWYRGVVAVELNMCPATGMCLGTGTITFASAEDVVRGLRSLKREHLEPFDASLWAVVDDVSKFVDVLDQMDAAPLTPELLFVLGLVGVKHWGSEELNAIFEGVRSFEPVLRCFISILVQDANLRRAKREGEKVSPVADAASPMQARLRSLLQLSSILSDGNMVYPYPVREAPPSADAAGLVAELREYDTAAFDYEAEETTSAVTVHAVYESESPWAGVTSVAGRYSLELDLLQQGLTALGDVTATEMTRRDGSGAQTAPPLASLLETRSSFWGPEKDAAPPTSGVRRRGPTVEEVD